MAVPRQPNYRTLPQKAAALQYHLTMNHPFLDGNKRFAVAAMEVFVVLNDADLLTTDEKLVEVSLRVASHEWDKGDLISFLEARVFRRGWSEHKIGSWLDRAEELRATDVSAATERFIDDDPTSLLSLRVRGALARKSSWKP